MRAESLYLIEMLQELIDELRKIVPFKDTTAAGDLVLIAADNPRMLLYALVEAIDPDPRRKGVWWNVQMHVLTVPPQRTVWTLREQQFTGREIFTMGGEERFLQAVQLDGLPVLPSKPFQDRKGDAPPKGKPFRRLK